MSEDKPALTLVSSQERGAETGARPPKFLDGLGLEGRAEILLLALHGLKAVGEYSEITDQQLEMVICLAQDVCWQARDLERTQAH
jgi:hypothetical protein